MAENNIRLSKWSCEDVARWLNEEGFGDYSEVLCSQHKIDGQTLLILTEDDLKQPPIKMSVLGDIKRIMSKVNQLRRHDPEFETAVANMSGVQPQSVSNPLINSSHKLSEPRLVKSSLQMVSAHPRLYTMISQESKSLDPELWKTLLSFFYVFSVFLLTAFVMVIVHDRVPDMQKYPPLPDLFLDNMPLVPWAFEACELVGTTLCIMWVAVLVFHKHRFILLRRMFSLLGTIFLLRCVCMLITSMSVPGRHLQCAGHRYGDWRSRIARTLDIWRGLDTPKTDFYYLHMTSWVLNIFGIFFILAAHEHYSIDVFIAFYITSRLFMYYHTLANNRSLMQQDAQRTRAWFPLFSFFESRCDGIVPNEFEWPFSIPSKLMDLTKTKPSSSSAVKQD
ncbi:hypothetical protein BaRGS_00010171 [Batillaria attramentaria]|uniref:SAM domain-containing protein n=1 Tax=Batillaria attramentaria TaxID=370345 RepID=A0ABD0LH36_9CAEN